MNPWIRPYLQSVLKNRPVLAPRHRRSNRCSNNLIICGWLRGERRARSQAPRSQRPKKGVVKDEEAKSSSIFDQKVRNVFNLRGHIDCSLLLRYFGIWYGRSNRRFQALFNWVAAILDFEKAVWDSFCGRREWLMMVSMVIQNSDNAALERSRGDCVLLRRHLWI